jgi:hypothetical protein
MNSNDEDLRSNNRKLIEIAALQKVMIQESDPEIIAHLQELLHNIQNNIVYDSHGNQIYSSY